MRLIFSHAFKFEKYFYQLYSAFLITFTALFQYKGFFFFHYVQDTHFYDNPSLSWCDFSFW